jgi:hypothetical protein
VEAGVSRAIAQPTFEDLCGTLQLGRIAEVGRHGSAARARMRYPQLFGPALMRPLHDSPSSGSVSVRRSHARNSTFLSAGKTTRSAAMT